MEIPVAVGAFCLFVLYDINSVTFHKKGLQPFFFTGCLLLAWISGRCLVSSIREVGSGPVRICVCGLGALICLGLLFYTLFFAIPFSSTYVQPREQGQRPQVCKTGVYGLCRHPGVLCLSSVCLFLAGMAPTARLVALCAAICLLNVLYVCFQDVWTFPRTFCDYDDYRKEVPFLIPRRKRGGRP